MRPGHNHMLTTSGPVGHDLQPACVLFEGWWAGAEHADGVDGVEGSDEPLLVVEEPAVARPCSAAESVAVTPYVGAYLGAVRGGGARRGCQAGCRLLAGLILGRASRATDLISVQTVGTMAHRHAHFYCELK